MSSKKSSSIHTRAGDKEYDRLLKSLQPANLQLIRSSAVLNPEAFFDDMEKQSKQSISIEHEASLQEMDKKHFGVKATLSLELKSPKRKAPALKLGVTYLAYFHSDRQFTQTLAKRFVKTEFSVFIWPFFREYVHGMTARMSIPPFLVPLITKMESKAVDAE